MNNNKYRAVIYFHENFGFFTIKIYEGKRLINHYKKWRDFFDNTICDLINFYGVDPFKIVIKGFCDYERKICKLDERTEKNLSAQLREIQGNFLSRGSAMTNYQVDKEIIIKHEEETKAKIKNTILSAF